jgi:hypothetical protein
MIVEISRAVKNGEAWDRSTIDVKIKSYKKIAEPKSLYLVGENQRCTEQVKDDRQWHIYKILFIASCQTDLYKDEILIAFFVEDECYADLRGFILSNLPNSDSAHCRGFFYREILLDYQAYLEVCELTGERKMSLGELIEYRLDSGFCVNSLLKSKDGILNFDQQIEYWNRLDQANKR